MPNYLISDFFILLVANSSVTVYCPFCVENDRIDNNDLALQNIVFNLSVTVEC